MAHIQDVNDNPPRFAQEFYSLEWPYDDVTQLLIGDVDATDVDTNEGGIVGFTFSEDNDKFHIGVDTGKSFVQRIVYMLQIIIYC